MNLHRQNIVHETFQDQYLKFFNIPPIKPIPSNILNSFNMLYSYIYLLHFISSDFYVFI